MNKTPLIAAHLDHRRSFSNFDYVYPVISRRAQGLSIGVNLNPDKVCNFDCVYCEVDRKTCPRRLDVDVLVVAQELRDMIRIYREGILFEQEPFFSVPAPLRLLKGIAFSGDGEPTACPVFEQAVEAAWYVRDSLGLDSIKLILITNASCLDRPGVRRGIRRMQDGEHEVWAKLDAGTSAYFQFINRSSVPYTQVLTNIIETAQWCPLIIQSLFVRLTGQPLPEGEVLAYADRLNEIRALGGNILGLQLYTLARPAATPGVEPYSYEEMNHIAALVQEKTGLPHLVFYGDGPS